ncbi:ABC transporter [[Clostridium] sordellii]|uniref:ABC transporter ATP-binding protein n=1 Tax=Paraclostridium sordellii TaxID=1505 RepID=UPI000541D2E1|nr:ABC transporter ATP-binding protein [Paeniclostridium sordellii]CEK34011.1 ABC transporter,Lipoprotein-releasing system ATP-binding protein LolD,macrolide transporter ATP-binding /permease protein,Predicted ABC-type transport system involved in lysophospholipase L1 biosynthesis, ATPase component,lipoprotein releasing system, ATP-binding protein,ABC transporter [[Clostridium] sordellii] [Paeniclostridium sordellii]CEQ30100.1 ABC transporter [[Clostridium] sordellii] [Paeniclostridium sordellii]
MKSIIKARGLCKSFILGKTANNVLKNINLDIYEGDFTVIMGSSGSGKSTLLYSISTMDNPSAGNLELLGKDITNLNEKEATEIRNKYISFVFQSINLLYDLTIKENITYTGYLNNKDKKSVNKKAEELIDRLELKEVENKYPSEISGGQQQRVAIARALINTPKVIFGDEPTGALNSSTGKKVLDILTELNNEGQSIVMVTHDLKAASRASRLIYLKDGRIDGDLDLGKFNEKDLEGREEKIFEFIKSRGW